MKHHQTSVPYLCLPTCVAMLTGRDVNDIADLLDFRPEKGTNRWDLTRLGQWGYDVSLGFGSLARLKDCLERGVHPILSVLLRNGEPHAIVLASLGEDEWRIHDPVQSGPIDIPAEMLLARWGMMGRFMAVITPGETSVGQSGGGFPGVGFVYDANGNPLEVYSLAPARQTNFGKIVKVSGILLSGNSIAAGQAENNTLSGLFLAWQNIRFPHISIPTRVNNRVLECATLDYFAVVLDDTIRGYDWDGKEFLCTGMEIKIDNKNGIISSVVEGEASTWGPDGVAGPYPDDPPPDNPPNDNPSEYWPDWPPGVTPDNPDGDPPPWAEDGALVAPVAYLSDRSSGRIFRATDYPTSVFYEDLDVVSANGIKWIALDEFDRENGALVCGNAGVWKTEDLSSPIPTWTQVLTPPGGWVFDMVRSSPVQQGVWAVSGMKIGATGAIGVWWSTSEGDLGTWSNHLNLRCGSFGTYATTYLELSSHVAGRMWVNWWLWDGAWAYSTHTDDFWATRSCDILPNAFRPNSTDHTRVCSHHPEPSNEDDQIAVWAAGLFRTDNRTFRCTADTGGCAGFVDLCTGTTLQGVKDIGLNGTNRWWLLTRCDGGVSKFFTSFTGATWLEKHEFAGVTDHVANRAHPDLFVATNDGAVYPLLYSSNRGNTWTERPGNWAALGRTGNIQCVALVS